MLGTVRGCDAGGSRVRRTRREALSLGAGIGIVLWCDKTSAPLGSCGVTGLGHREERVSHSGMCGVAVCLRSV